MMYTDDITQIITHPSPRANFIKLATNRDINKIIKFEGEWKIKTKINKFLVIPAARTKPGYLDLNYTNINYTKEGRLLGLKITNTGTAGHVKERRAMARKMLTKLKRFSGCPERVKLHLYKALVRPIIEYPPIPLHTISRTPWHQLQGIQNKAVLWAKGVR